RDLQAAGQEGRLAQALLKGVELEVERLEDVGIGEERDRVAGVLALVQLPALLELAGGHAPRVLLGEYVRVAVDLDVEAFGQRVDYRDADAVQAAGDLVTATVAELATGVQDGEDDFDRRFFLLLHDRDGDAASVVDHRHGVVGVDRHRDLAAE